MKNPYEVKTHHELPSTEPPHARCSSKIGIETQLELGILHSVNGGEDGSLVGSTTEEEEEQAQAFYDTFDCNFLQRACQSILAWVGVKF